jgi:prepilin-type N-terminal cleavage/methylation domain-containing protein
MKIVNCKLKIGTPEGFTLIELLIVLAVTLLLALVSAPIYGNLQVSAQLNENTSELIQTIRTARTRAAARVNNAQHGVYFNITGGDDQYILYQGASYATRTSTYDRVETLDGALALSASLTGGAVDLNFSRGLGLPSVTGTLTLTHITSGTRTVNINSYALVEEQ